MSKYNTKSLSEDVRNWQQNLPLMSVSTHNTGEQKKMAFEDSLSSTLQNVVH